MSKEEQQQLSKIYQQEVKENLQTQRQPMNAAGTLLNVPAITQRNH